MPLPRTFRLRLTFGVFSVALLVALVGATLASSSDHTEAAGPPSNVGSALGRMTIAGQETYVHVTVATLDGGDPEAAANAELRRRGAVPVQSAEYAKSGTWKQFSNSATNDDVVTVYFDAGSGPGYPGAAAAWNGVAGSSFAFSDLGSGGCPSLVPECPGSQAYNNLNEAGWADIDGGTSTGITIGITYFNFKTRGGPFAAPQEADMVLNSNSRINWGSNDVYPTGGDWDIDIITVAAHEFGHVAGLGHSNDLAALMYPSYKGARDSSPVQDLLGQDDINGIVALYPAVSGDPEPEPTGWCASHDNSHPAWTKKGCE